MLIGGGIVALAVFAVIGAAAFVMAGQAADQEEADD